MYVKVRSMDATQTAVLNISKITMVEDFRLLVQEKFNAPPERQRLFYRGKQMEDGHRLFDYSVNVNDVIQLMIKPILNELTNQRGERAAKGKSSSTKKQVSNKENCTDTKDESSPSSLVELNDLPLKKSLYYEEDDLVDAKCLYDGTWWEGKITKIAPNTKCKKKTELDDGLFYYVKFERYADVPEDELKLEHVRPRARTKIPLKDLRPGDKVMVNYNLERPEERGFWYDCEVTEVIDRATHKKLVGTLWVAGSEENRVPECHIHLVKEVFQIEPHVLLSERTARTDGTTSVPTPPPDKRQSGPNCATCKDIPGRKCSECGCAACRRKHLPEQQLMCDECDRPFHIFCLDPPLESIPDVEDWFCPECRTDTSEIVGAGERLKESKKHARLASSRNAVSRDWGKGFACAGRQKVCTLVPHDHFGPIPGVEVGTLWKFRLQVSEAGVHRPHVAGIHGRESQGAYSIVLAGGYEDDEDRGNEFTYTGSGGRDLSGNKRTAEQSCDQVLTRMNKALALNCNAPLNQDGATAKNWKEGKPVRVVRNYKGNKHSKFAPEEGNRYDGIYKVVKYWQALGKSGFKVWRYMLRRDDPGPSPWSLEGQKRIVQLGLSMQYPDGYLEAMKEKANSAGPSHVPLDDEEDEAPVKKGRKRKSQKGLEGNDNAEKGPAMKKKKGISYELDPELAASIGEDKINAKVWAECKEEVTRGKASFLTAVQERFVCMCCQVLVHNPVSTPCAHNVCQTCLERSFSAEVYSCPSCRHNLGKEFKGKVNKPLNSALNFLFPGYGAQR